MNRIVKTVIENFSRSYTEYRFDSISNFLSYEQFQEKEAIDKIIRLGEELKRIKDFKAKSNDDLQNMVNRWLDGENVSMSDDLFYKYQGIDADYELKRRKDEAYAIKMGWR